MLISGFSENFLAYIVLFVAIAASLLGLFVYLYFNGQTPRGQMRQAPGSRIALVISERFSPSDRFTGFVHEASGASIVLMELPGSAFERLKNLEEAAATFAAQGVENLTRQSLAGRIGEYVYLRGEQKTALVDYDKYILVFRQRALTGMVTANIPRAALTTGLVTGSEIETMLNSARIRADMSEPRKLFSFGYLGPFEEDFSLLGTAKGYRLKNSHPQATQGGLRPLFLVAPSMAQAPIDDLSHLAERSFDNIDQLRDKAVEAKRKLAIAGLNAFEMIGGGVDSNTGEAAFLYQLIVESKNGRYFKMVGIAPAANREKLLPEYRKMAESFEPA